MHTVMVYRGHRVIKHNSRCIKTYLQNGIKGQRPGHPHAYGHQHPRSLLPPAGALPGRLWGEERLVRGILVMTAVPTFKIFKRFPWKSSPSLAENLHQLSLFVPPPPLFCFLFFNQGPEMSSSAKHRKVSEEQQS